MTPESKLRNNERSRRWAAANPERNAASSRRWAAANPEKVITINRRYRQANSEKRSASFRRWYLSNKKRILSYKKTRYASDLGFRLLTNCRNRIRDAMQGKSKSQRTVELIGCSIPYLNIWMELQFQKDMTWENYGDWHIDHIRPCASFDLSDPKQQQQCFHYTNLQPLWAEKNLQKKDTWR